MNKTYYILHGYNGFPDQDWFPWLKAELEKQGHKVITLALPNPAEPKLGEWLDALTSAIKQHGEGIIIGHSLGGALTMRYIEAGGKPQQVILVAAPFEKIVEIPAIDNFLDRPFNIPAQVLIDTEFTVIGSEDDPYVPFEHTLKWAELLGVQPQTFKDKGHFCEWTFPEILDYI